MVNWYSQNPHENNIQCVLGPGKQRSIEWELAQMKNILPYTQEQHLIKPNLLL